MLQHNLLQRPRRARRTGLLVGLVLAALALSGCQYKLSDGFLVHGASEGAQRVTTLWNGAWIALIAVGLLVWGLIAWCLIAYRHKEGDDELPPQLRYNVPIEILYTVIPVMMIVAFFYFTARDESALIDTSGKADNVIVVVGKQWSWDFSYVGPNVHESGTQAIMTGQPGDENTVPTLYLPLGQRTRFVLMSRDVDHSFWIPAFQQKMDTIPGRVNKFDVVPTELGHFLGKCAELCGTYHSNMLFNVEVVTPEVFAQQMQKLKDQGQTGLLLDDLSRTKLMTGQEQILKQEGVIP